jgi:RNA polymerase sigma-70 factor, ECF subfamily
VAAALLVPRPGSRRALDDVPDDVIDLRVDDADGIDVDAALRMIIDEYSPAMYRVARSIVRDAALAEDVVQESVVKAWKALAGFRGDASLRSWVLRITHNTAISTLRKRREEYRDPSMMPEDATLDAIGPHREVAGKMMLDELWTALDQLDDLSRTIVILREIEGMPYEDIAEALQIALPTVKTRLFRARRQLATSLSEWT